MTEERPPGQLADSRLGEMEAGGGYSSKGPRLMGTRAWNFQSSRFVKRSQQSGFLWEIFQLLNVGN